MISRTTFYSNVKNSNANYANQTSEERGQGNLFVGGTGNDVVINDADNALILAGDGDDSIASNGTQNIIEGGDGDDTIVSQGDQNAISGGSGDDTIVSTGNGNVIAGHDGNDNIKSTGDYNFISGGNGNDNVVSIGDHNTIDGNAGNDTILSLGDFVAINVGEGDNNVTFWGDNYNITGGNGDNTAQTLDFAIADGNYEEYASYLEPDTTVTSNTVKTSTSTSQYDMAAIKAEIAKKYNLSPAEIATLNSIDLNAKYSDGSPLYAIAMSIKNPGHYVIVRRDGATHARGVTTGECIATNNSWASDLIKEVGEKTITNTYTTTTTYSLHGVSNVNVNFGNGDNTVHITADKNVYATLGNGDNDVLIRNGFTCTDVDVETDTETQSLNFGILTSNATHTSPLIIDFNQDGKVSATAGQGIDLDNNGSADGCASNGDKMLAMTDLNGNGKIDGAEVFGDQTVDPFTGKALNAANGFEALAMVAKSAEKYAGIKCIDAEGNVDLNALNQALQTRGIKLGFVSDDNNTTVEDLSKVASINTSNYIEQEDSGDAQHRQLGTTTFLDGSTNKVDDVWFTLTGLEENPFNLARFLEALTA